MTNGDPAYLVDTNVLIYAYDAADSDKRRRAIESLVRLRRFRLGALSVQILGEFYTNVTKKPQKPLTPQEARDTSIRLCLSWPVLDLTVRTHLDAVRGVQEYRMSYWDALVWATARENGVPFIVTEDQEHGRLIEDIRYMNPFHAKFDLAMLS
jgi:predicted nucleic acid-binding protein